jgi:hypothetical protein
MEVTVNDLVQRLSEGQHPVEVRVHPDGDLNALQAALERGHVHIRFTGTRGGTELGIPLDRERSNLADADFTSQSGNLRIVGDLVLDYEPVRCIADIELPTLRGQGKLERVPKA